MYILIFISLLCLLFTYCESIGKMKNGMAWGFTLLTILAALHYDFGNDYMPYLRTYNEITSYGFDWVAIINKDVWKEPGWALLCYAFYPIGGFFSLVIFLSILQNVIYYKFIRRYVDSKWWVFAVFIYLFSTSYYVLNMSMFRQGLAIALFVWAFTFIKDKKLLPAAALVIIAASVHNSAKVLLPFLFWGFIPMNEKSSKVISVLSAVLFVVLFFSPDTVNSLFMGLSDFEDVQIYSDTYGDSSNKASFGIGFILNTIPFVMFLYYMLKNNEAEVWQRQLVSLACIGTFIIPFGQIIPMIGRIGMYFGVFTISSIPIVYKWIPNYHIKRAVLFIFIMMTLYDYYLFFTDSAFAKSYSTYHTIFSAM